MKKKIPNRLLSNPRFQAVLSLERTVTGSYSNLMVNETLKKGHLSKEDARLFTELVYGTLSRQITLDYQLAPFLKDPKKLAPWVKTLLQTALFQLLYLDRIPSHAVLNESVEIAKSYGHQGIANLVNGVLRSFQRKGPKDFDQISDPLKRLSIKASFPEELLLYLIEQLGFEKAEKVVMSLLTPAHVSARVDLMQLSQQEAIDCLKEEGIEAVKSAVAPAGIIGEKGFLAGSKLFKEGKLTVQDESSMLVAPNMTLKEDVYVLDACAAPGGKTTHIASFLKKGKVVALDIHAHKVKLIEENAARLHVSDRIDTKVLDAREVENTFEKNTFDAILVDAPCSGLGLMRRKPDIKYQKNPAALKGLPKIQREILESVAPTLKKEGILVYSTCTITPDENEKVVEAFLKDHPEFILEKLPIQLPNKTGLTVTIYPDDYTTDGFFISRMRKVHE